MNINMIITAIIVFSRLYAYCLLPFAFRLLPLAYYLFYGLVTPTTVYESQAAAGAFVFVEKTRLLKKACNNRKLTIFVNI